MVNIYTSKFINIISLIITIIIYLVMNFFINHVNFKVNKVKFNADFVSEKTINLNNINSVNSSEKTLEQNLIEEQWYIQIDKISLKAPIAKDTTKDVLENYVGHFNESPLDKGNICLAAHNRGYKNNYFNRIKELKEGDEIKYVYKNIERTYEVTKQEIIKNTDWENLENTEENKITLITCVENEPDYRRCIQGIEK